MRRRAWFFALCCLAGTIATSLPSSVRAEQGDSAAYREVIEEALAEYGVKNYEEASTLFTRAHALSPNARTLRGMGMAAFELRRYEESVEHLRAALLSRVKPLQGGLRVETEALLSRARGFIADVNVSAQPARAELLVDGVRTDANEPLLLRLGEHRLDLKLDGKIRESRVLRVRGGEVLELRFVLEPARASDKPAETRRPVYKNAWLWTGVGAVVVGAAATGVALSMADRSSATRTVPEPTLNTPPGVVLLSGGTPP